MKTVTYRTTDRWVGTMTCPACRCATPAWRSSGMSDCWPHFYCNRCSNAVWRLEDQDSAWERQDEETLAAIAATLPDCPCGGSFVPGANPKCPGCGAEFTHQNEPLKRLTDPCVILIDGACFFGTGEPYRVEILKA